MKALSSIIIVLIAAFASFGANAPFEVKETGENVFNIQYQSTQKGKVEVSILKSESEVIFSEVINNLNTFVRPYNFSNLPEGIYIFMVQDENGEHMETIIHTLEKPVHYTHVAPLPNQDNKYWLNVFSSGSETVNVRILSQTGGTLFEQSVFVTGNYKVVYDLNKVKKNELVTFEVTDSEGQLYTATF